MQRMVELVKGQAEIDILAQQPHDLGLKCPPGGAKLRQTLFGLRTTRSFKNRVRVGGKLLPAQSPCGLVAERLCVTGSLRVNSR